MNKNCNACEELRTDAPDFVQNGVTDKVCASLKNDTGFSPTSGNNDCTDLDNANDCLVGNMADEIEAYDVCDWKKYMRKFVPNIFNVIKGIICSICGIWTNVHKHDCEINYLFNGASFSVGEEPSDGSYIVAGKGISYLIPKDNTSQHTGDLSLLYVSGGFMRAGGTYNFNTNNFTDDGECINFDNGATERTSRTRLGNNIWGKTGRTVNGGELIAEYRIKLSEYPEIKTIFSGIGQEVGAGGFHVTSDVFTAGQYAYGQHGRCDTSNGNPSSTGDSTTADRGHKVPDGWIYVQIRMQYIWLLDGNGHSYSPRVHMGCRMNNSKLEC